MLHHEKDPAPRSLYRYVCRLLMMLTQGQCNLSELDRQPFLDVIEFADSLLGQIERMNEPGRTNRSRGR